MIKTLVATLIAACSLYAQTATVNLSGQASARPGATVPLSLTYSVSTASGVQWIVTPPSGYVYTPTIGSNAQTANKTLYCNPANNICLVIGINQTLIPTGEIAKYSVIVPTGAAAGPVTFVISGVVATDPNGSAIPISAGPNFVLTILSKYDINGDGVTNAADLTLAIPQVTGQAACGLADVNGDGACDVKDLQLIAKAIQGL